jgi:prepilin-type N-terminal cleavage/methylation domain-containing protein
MIRGFTLLEILASVVVLGLLSVTLMTTMRIAGRSGAPVAVAPTPPGLLPPPDRLSGSQPQGVRVTVVPSENALPKDAGPTIQWLDVRGDAGGDADACLRLAGVSTP